MSSCERSVLSLPFWYSFRFRCSSKRFHLGSFVASLPTPTIFMDAIVLILGSNVHSYTSDTSFYSRIYFLAASFFWDLEAKRALWRFCDKFAVLLNSLSFDLLAILVVYGAISGFMVYFASKSFCTRFPIFPLFSC